MLLSKPVWSVLLGILGLGAAAWAWSRAGRGRLAAGVTVIELEDSYRIATRNGATKPRVRTGVSADF
ncbi:MAG: hypothetical protein HY217_09670 [Candidatus Rokubacteria bacterium]|nr:hypothetical protein [Candidatus Rokubacteria bacterium]